MESRLERCSLKEAGISASGVQKFLDEIQTGGYHLHSLDTAVFVALHHAIGADTPVVVVKGKDVSI